MGWVPAKLQTTLEIFQLLGKININKEIVKMNELFSESLFN